MKLNIERLTKICEEYKSTKVIKDFDDVLFFLKTCFECYQYPEDYSELYEILETYSDELSEYDFESFINFYQSNDIREKTLEYIDDIRHGNKFDLISFVYKHKPTNRYLEIGGFYSSFNGVSIDETWNEVKPVEKIIIEYQAV